MGTKQKCYMLFWTNPGSSTQQNSSCTATCFPSHKPYNKTKKTYRTLLEKQGRTHKKYSLIHSCSWMCQCWPISKDLHQLRTDIGCNLEDCQEEWIIGKDSERESGNSMLSVWLDDGDDDDIYNSFFKVTIGFPYPVSWGCRIHWLLLCRGVRPPPQRVSCIWH